MKRNFELSSFVRLSQPRVNYKIYLQNVRLGMIIRRDWDKYRKDDSLNVIMMFVNSEIHHIY